MPWAGKVIAIVSALCLRLQANDPAVVSGTVTNADTGEALTEATVCAVYGEDWYYWTMTDSEGNYTLNVPAGENVVIGASYGDCISSQVGPLNIGSGASITQDFALTPIKVTAILGIASGDQVGCGFEVRLEAVLNLPPAQAVWYSSIQWGGSPTTDGGRITNAIFHDVGLNKTVSAKCPLQTTPVEITGIEVVQDEGVTITLSPESSGVIKWTVTYGKLYNCSASHPIVVAPGNTLELHLDPDFPDATDTALACAATHAYANGVPGSFEVVVANSVTNVASTPVACGEIPEDDGGYTARDRALDATVAGSLTSFRQRWPHLLGAEPVTSAVAVAVTLKKAIGKAGSEILERMTDYLLDSERPVLHPPGPQQPSFEGMGCTPLPWLKAVVTLGTAAERPHYKFWAVKNAEATLSGSGSPYAVQKPSGDYSFLWMAGAINSPSGELRDVYEWSKSTSFTLNVCSPNWDNLADDGPTHLLTSGIYRWYNDKFRYREVQVLWPDGSVTYKREPWDPQAPSELTIRQTIDW